MGASAAARQPAGGGGRKMVPRELKLLTSNSPGRDAGNRLIPPPVPLPRGPLVKPDYLSEDASWMWDRVVEQMESVGLLKPLDAPALEAACENFATFREAVRWRHQHGLVNKGPQGVTVAAWVKAQLDSSREFRTWCAEFGMTPAAVHHLAAESGASDGPGDNPFR
jgi:P27 family predicted phage terminase small subunit